MYEARENGLLDYEGGIVTHEELDIQTAGFTKCRFPVLAKRYVVRDGEVLHADLSSPDPIDE
ncbi:hypothetical protein C487_19693 [Natrinema pallidum DSM 3751]|uniref:Uncharacterized protein n=1 Tax=Natrinema pallidum DSM 3751 TaxID=1227495 RepID=L9YDF3_9EURY|nr:hypothetical protein C487_19693 [Natrinema pallidum DSM 3751]